MTITHSGSKQFLEGTFGSGGENLFVDARGTIRRITDNDLDNTGTFDIVLPNSHGYVDQGPTYVYSQDDGEWEVTELPHESCWMAEPVDVDGDGHLDLVIANGENGVTSELESYVYWGGPGGLTGARTTLDTTGAYDIAVCDLDGNGLQDHVFTTAWTDHHNPGKPMDQTVYVQTSPREFADATDQYAVPGVATTSLLAEDLDGDGHPDVVLANQREGHDFDTHSFLYWGSAEGFDTAAPVRLPTTAASQVLAADLSDDGYDDLIFTGGGRLLVYWNDAGTFRPDDRLVLEAPGLDTQFTDGRLTTTAADVDRDGVLELVIATREGVQIRKADDLRNVWRSLPCENCSWVAVADVEDGGWKDIVVSRYRTARSYDTESMVFWGATAATMPRRKAPSKRTVRRAVRPPTSTTTVSLKSSSVTP